MYVLALAAVDVDVHGLALTAVGLDCYVLSSAAMILAFMFSRLVPWTFGMCVLLLAEVELAMYVLILAAVDFDM